MKLSLPKIILFISASLISFFVNAQLFSQNNGFTLADTLRGSLTPERIWWDALHYDLSVNFDIAQKKITGTNRITFKVLTPGNKMQIDLMEPMQITDITMDGAKVEFTRSGAVHYLIIPKEMVVGNIETLEIHYTGSPQIAKNAPWDGGIIYKTDANGKPWVSIACQGLGASVWYPNKDHQADEPDSVRMRITIPGDLVAVSNGMFESRIKNPDNTVTYIWKVVNPINNYNFIPYIGDYARYEEVYQGEKGPLKVEMWFLKYNMDQAKKHVLPEIRRTIEAFEYWFGPFPFYEDGFKMVEAPHLGMEHQSAIAYGNNFKYGYLGMDLSGAGPGLRWDYIVVHEAGHEWFGNNITTKDIADMWVHEGFTSYSEVLFTDYWYGKKDGNAYAIGLQNNIGNDANIIGTYNVNKEGSGDMYAKGAAMLHTIRQIMDNDESFRQMLRSMNKDFYHQTITSADIEKYISTWAKKDFSPVFEQYLRTTNIPEFEYNIVTDKKGTMLVYKWSNTVPYFNMPVKITIQGAPVWLQPGSTLKRLQLPSPDAIVESALVDKNFYVKTKKTDIK